MYKLVLIKAIGMTLEYSLGETNNGYPTISVDAPYELFGEFLRSEHSKARAERLALAVEDVWSGNSVTAEVAQDYGVLSLDKEAGTAKVWIDNLSQGIEEECEMPLADFRELSTVWLDFIGCRS